MAAGDTPCAGALCASEGNPRRARRRRMCDRCYQRWWKATPPEERAPIPSRARRPLSERIKANLSPGGPDDCHEWLGGRDEHGYGLINVNGRSRRTHRVALICALGRDEPGKDACHTCDNPPCCNTRHLYFGTRKENMRDAITRHRRRIGSESPQAILSENAVLAIRVRWAAGERTRMLADEYGVTSTTITGIVRGRKWRHVGGPIVPAGTPQRRSAQSRRKAS